MHNPAGKHNDPLHGVRPCHATAIAQQPRRVVRINPCNRIQFCRGPWRWSHRRAMRGNSQQPESKTTRGREKSRRRGFRLVTAGRQWYPLIAYENLREADSKCCGHRFDRIRMAISYHYGFTRAGLAGQNDAHLDLPLARHAPRPAIASAVRGNVVNRVTKAGINAAGNRTTNPNWSSYSQCITGKNRVEICSSSTHQVVVHLCGRFPPQRQVFNRIDAA
ncbi:hypothetical protein P3T25_007705 [Paraburkholderia sp. GAS32]